MYYLDVTILNVITPDVNIEAISATVGLCLGFEMMLILIFLIMSTS